EKKPFRASSNLTLVCSRFSNLWCISTPCGRHLAQLVYRRHVDLAQELVSAFHARPPLDPAHLIGRQNRPSYGCSIAFKPGFQVGSQQSLEIELEFVVPIVRGGQKIGRHRGLEALQVRAQSNLVEGADNLCRRAAERRRALVLV